MTKKKTDTPPEDESELCLNPNCEEFAATRGLCTACYSLARRMVKAEEATWEDLVDRGLAYESRRSRKENSAFALGSETYGRGVE